MTKIATVIKVIIITLILFLPILVYILQFGSYKWSDSPEDWAAFGDYAGGIYSGILATSITIAVYYFNKTETKKKERTEVAAPLYSQISKFLYELDREETVNISEVNQFTKSIISNKLLLPKELFDKLIEFSDYCKEVAANNNRVIEKEIQIEKELREYCNGKNF